MEDFLNLIANVGFPIAVAAYLLIRVENKLGDLARAISELRECIITLPGRLYHVPHEKTTGSNSACPPA